MTASTRLARAPPQPPETRTSGDHTHHTPHHERKTMYRKPTARVVAYYPPTKLQPSGRAEVECPWCVQRDRYRRLTDQPSRHLHGLGHAGQHPDAGHRAAHCLDQLGRGYEITDPDGLLPSVMTIEPIDLTAVVTS